MSAKTKSYELNQEISKLAVALLLAFFLHSLYSLPVFTFAGSSVFDQIGSRPSSICFYSSNSGTGQVRLCSIAQQ